MPCIAYADVEAHMQVWQTPEFGKSMTPMHLHRTYGQCHADVTALDWSEDSQWLAAVSKDLAARYVCNCIARLRALIQNRWHEQQQDLYVRIVQTGRHIICSSIRPVLQSVWLAAA